jgi:Zn-dependent oligopeptidase
MAKNPMKTDRKSGTQQTDASLLSGIRELILEARRTVARGVNAALVWTNFEIGRRIIEYGQSGKKRAEYAESNLRQLATKLTAEFGKGYSKSNLEYMRKFYLMYKKTQTLSGQSEFPRLQTSSVESDQTGSQIVQTPSAQSARAANYATPSRISGVKIWQTVSAKSPEGRKSATVSRMSQTIYSPRRWKARLDRKI